MPRIPAKRICLLRTSAIGDIVHAMVLAQGLRSGYPDARITWITQDIPGSLIRGNSSIDSVLTFRRHMNFRSWLDLRKQIRKDYYDLLIVPQVSAKASLLASWVRAEIKLGFDYHRTREFNWLVTNRKIPNRAAGHVLDQFMEFLDYLQIDHSEPVWDFNLTPEELNWRDRWRCGFKKPILAIVPASSNPEKDWIASRFADLADRAGNEFNLEPVIICGPGRREMAIAQSINEIAQSKPLIASEKPIRHTLLQLSSARIVVGPDTGPLHMAVALGIPTIGLYGYSNPNRCGPYRFRELIIDKFNDPGKSTEVISRQTKSGRMKSISVEDVMVKIRLELER